MCDQERRNEGLKEIRKCMANCVLQILQIQIIAELSAGSLTIVGLLLVADASQRAKERFELERRSEIVLLLSPFATSGGYF